MTAPMTHAATCRDGTCVRVTDSPDNTGVVFDSTIDGNDNHLPVTYAEFVAFIDDVKAGGFDELYHRAKTAATAEALLTA